MMFDNVPGRHAMNQLRGEVNRLFTGVLENLGGPWLPVGQGQPGLCAWEQPDGFVVEMELPGVSRDRLELSVVENELSVKLAETADDDPQVTYHRRERPAQGFTRSIRLPTPVNAERVTADLREGVLTIRLPKSESAKAHKINVTTA